MKKKSSGKKVTPKVKKTSSVKYEISQIAIFIPLFLLIIGGTAIYKASSKTHVLGATTGPVLLARDGNDSGSGGGSDSSGSGGSGESSGGSTSNNG